MLDGWWQAVTAARSRPRRSDRRSRPGPAWRVAGLALAVAATSVAVPPLILSWSRQDPGGTASSQVITTGAPSTPSTATSSTPPPGPAVPGSPSPAFRPMKIAAADPANTRYGVAVTECPLCASGSRVQYLGQGHALIVPVRGVAVGGRRTLTIVYESAGSRTLFVDVNGDSVVSLTLEGAGSWEVPARVSIPIDLPAGDSVLKFYNAADPAPDLDQLRIT